MHGSTITLADRRGVPEAKAPSGQLAFKRAAETEAVAGQTLGVDEAEGIVTAIVSVTGVKDEVDDVIVPGAYQETLTKRNPKVCWAHSWSNPIGRVLHIEELLPGDKRLPSKARDGSLWPKQAGALVATMQFNMRSTEGKQAFEAVVFYSETGECEYSIGYQVPDGKAATDRKGIRHIKALDLYELSVVLFGAHTMTGTLSIKAAFEAAMEHKSLRGMTGTTYHATGEDDFVEESAHKALADLIERDSGRIAALEKKEVDPPEQPAHDFSDGVMVAVYPDTGAADAVYGHIAGPDDNVAKKDLHVTLAFLGSKDEVDIDPDEIVKAVTGAVEGIPVLHGEIGGIGQFPDTGDGAPTWAPVDVPGLGMLREQIVAALGDDDVKSDHGFTPHMTLGYDIGIIDPVPPTPVTFSSVRVVYGTETYDVALGQGGLPPDGSGKFDGKSLDMDEYLMGFSDTDWDSLAKAVSSDEVKSLLADLDALDVKATTPGGRVGDDSPVGTPGGTQNWVDKAGGLPKYIRMVAHALIRKGATKARAIATAVATMKRWAANVGGKVSEKVQAAAAKAIAEWEAMKAKADATKAAAYDPSYDTLPIVTIYDPSLDVKGMGSPISESTYPYLPGTYEARMREVREAVTSMLRGEALNDDEDKYEWDYVDVRATWDDRVIATRHKWQPVECEESYEIPYTVDDDGVNLGEMDPVILQVVAIADDSDDDGSEADYDPRADAAPLADLIQNVAFTVKATKPGTIEGKAGRVLSGRNERRVRTAVRGLLDVLAAAGINIDPEEIDPRDTIGDFDLDSDQRREQDPRVDPETTAPIATTGTKSLTLDQVNADLAAFGASV